MDRLSWYQAEDSMEEVLYQAGNVGIYDGELKQSAFEQGTVSLTLQRIIWTDSSNPNCRLTLHHSLVDKLDCQHKTMFGRGKIIVSLKSVPPTHPQNPVTASDFKSLRFIFRNGGENDFYKHYVDTMNQQKWEQSSGNLHSFTLSQHVQPRNVGILGIEKQLAEQNQRTHDTISQAFKDMNKLMEQAKTMVTLSKNITERLRTRRGEITDDETVRFKSYLLGLGVSDPVTKNSYGSSAIYFEKLANELTAILLQPITDCGGTMTLTEAFCRVNRARGVELISPEDLLNACQNFDKIKSPVSLFTFESGVTVIQLRSLSADVLADEICQIIESTGPMDATRLAQFLGISLVLASERLHAAENQAKLCRDDTVEGLVFYPNLLLNS